MANKKRPNFTNIPSDEELEKPGVREWVAATFPSDYAGFRKWEQAEEKKAEEAAQKRADTQAAKEKEAQEASKPAQAGANK